MSGRLRSGGLVRAVECGHYRVATSPSQSYKHCAPMTSVSSGNRLTVLHPRKHDYRAETFVSNWHAHTHTHTNAGLTTTVVDSRLVCCNKVAKILAGFCN